MVCAVRAALAGTISPSLSVPGGRVLSRLSSAYCFGFRSGHSGLPEGRIGTPHCVQCYRQLPGQRDFRFARPGSAGDRLCPLTQARAAKLSRQDRICRFVQAFPSEPVTAFRDAPVPADFARFVAPWRQTEISARAGRSVEAFGVVERCSYRHRGDRSDSRCCHQKTYRTMLFGYGLNFAIESGNVLHVRLRPSAEAAMSSYRNEAEVECGDYVKWCRKVSLRGWPPSIFW